MTEKEEWERMEREYREDREKEYQKLYKWNNKIGCWTALYFIIFILALIGFLYLSGL